MTAPPGEPPPPTGGEEDEDFMPGDEKYTPEDEVQFVLNFCNERGISLPEAVDVGECVFLYSYGRKQILQIRRHLPDGPIPEAVYYLYYPLEGMEISSQIDRKELEITSGTDTYLVGKDNAGEISVCSEMPYAGDFIASCTAEYPESGEDETVIFVEVITSQPTKKEYIEELRQELEVNRGPRPRIVVASDLVHIMYNNLIDFDTVNIPHKAVHPWTTIVDGIFEKIWDWEFHTSNEAKSADNKLLDAIRSMLHLRIYDRKVGEKILEAKSDKEIEELIYNCIEEMYFDFQIESGERSIRLELPHDSDDITASKQTPYGEFGLRVMRIETPNIEDGSSVLIIKDGPITWRTVVYSQDSEGDADLIAGRRLEIELKVDDEKEGLLFFASDVLTERSRDAILAALETDATLDQIVEAKTRCERLARVKELYDDQKY